MTNIDDMINAKQMETPGFVKAEESEPFVRMAKIADLDGWVPSSVYNGTAERGTKERLMAEIAKLIKGLSGITAEKNTKEYWDAVSDVYGTLDPDLVGRYPGNEIFITDNGDDSDPSTVVHARMNPSDYIEEDNYTEDVYTPEQMAEFETTAAQQTADLQARQGKYGTARTARNKGASENIKERNQARAAARESTKTEGKGSAGASAAADRRAEREARRAAREGKGAEGDAGSA